MLRAFGTNTMGVVTGGAKAFTMEPAGIEIDTTAVPVFVKPFAFVTTAR